MKKEEKIFTKFLKEAGLKLSSQRMELLEAFLSQEKHMTVEEIYHLVRKSNPSIGHTTVYRTMKLLCECGLSRELKFDDGMARYEHNYGHEHHDHMICEKCGKYVEVFDKRIEKLQKEMAEKYGFSPEKHRLEIYGTCKDCKDSK